MTAREVLSADRIYYVATTGSDSNDGSIGSPFLTLQKSADTIKLLDLYGYGVTVQVADGSYSGGFRILGNIPGNDSYDTITLIGNNTTPSSVSVDTGTSHGLCADHGGRFTVRGFKLHGTNDSLGLRTEGEGSVIYCDGKMEYGVLGSALSAEYGSELLVLGSTYTISGNQDTHISFLQKGHVIVRNCSVTLSGTPVWGSAFCIGSRIGLGEVFGNTYSGSATGTRYVAGTNGVIFTNSSGANYFPGSSAGYLSDSSGVYV